jgi:hypothetical protein
MITEELWSELERQTPVLPGIVRRRVREDSERNLFVGVLHPGRQRVLLLSVTPEAAASLLERPETRAMRTTVEAAAEEAAVEIRVTLTVPEMARVFSPFVDDVVDAVAVAHTDLDAVAVLATRFHHWRRLLAGSGTLGLSENAAQGLYGELWTLRHLILDALGGAAIDAWTGPDREDRDFQWRDVAVEVKTTSGDNPQTVQITSERQLELEAFRELFLVTLSLDALTTGTGQTLNGLVDDLRSVLEEDPRLAFRDKLLAYGYLDADRDRSDGSRFSIRQMSVFRVGAGFPRITESEVPVGVGQVRYRLSVPACEPWRTTPDELQSSLGGADT